MTSPQFKKRTHRAKARLDAVSGLYQWIYRACDKARKLEPSTEAHIFARVDDIQKYMYEKMELELYQVLQEKNEAELSVIISAGLMFSAWRMTQGIYRFDDEIYQAVISTEKSENIPTHLLKNLPEWSVYIETTGLTCDFDNIEPLLGFWATFGKSEYREVLMLHADFDGSENIPPIMVIDLAYTSIDKAIKAILIENNRYSTENIQKMQWVYPAINLLLYLCADREITHKGKIEEPANPQAKKTKKGWKLFPANTLKVWDVGVRMGSIIRDAKQTQQSSNESTGRTLRPHVRRAHWRTIISGKMKDDNGNPIPSHKRRQDLRWMPPSFVNVDNADDLPAVIHKVK